MTDVACESKLGSVVRLSMHPCPGNWVAIGRVVVYHAWPAHAFCAGIKCCHCICRMQAFSYQMPWIHSCLELPKAPDYFGDISLRKINFHKIKLCSFFSLDTFSQEWLNSGAMHFILTLSNRIFWLNMLSIFFSEPLKDFHLPVFQNTSYRVKDLTKNTNYVFRVSAENKHGFSAPGDLSEEILTFDASKPGEIKYGLRSKERDLIVIVF